MTLLYFFKIFNKMEKQSFQSDHTVAELNKLIAQGNYDGDKL